MTSMETGDGGEVSERSEEIGERDIGFLRRAIELAARARSEGRHPFGALIVNGWGETIVEARNNAVRPASDPTQHAEMLACRAVARKMTEAQMSECTLYTSTEPCAMCAGAIYWVGVGRVVYALSEQGLAKYTGNRKENPSLRLPCRELFARGNRRVIVAGPAIEKEAGKVHEGFW
jgi:tRNA(Arg) A34 adenosine deaminase TadA